MKSLLRLSCVIPRRLDRRGWKESSIDHNKKIVLVIVIDRTRNFFLSRVPNNNSNEYMVPSCHLRRAQPLDSVDDDNTGTLFKGRE